MCDLVLSLTLLIGLCRIPPSQKLMAEATKKEQLIKRYEIQYSRGEIISFVFKKTNKNKDSQC
jgi:hypothetical protein